MTRKSADRFAVAVVVLLGTGALVAEGTRFSEVTPLTSSAGPTTDEAAPITLANPQLRQQSIADRGTQLAGAPNSGSSDMNTVNETGPHKGRYLFTVFETGQPGVQRHDLLTGATDTIWHSLAPGTHTSFDASFWTPWGTLITAEERWCTAAAGCTTSRNGRLFEFRNPIEAPPVTLPLTTASNVNADFVHQHEVYRLDRAHNTISLFASRSTVDLSTSEPVGSAFTNPDNLAVDHDSHIYIVEDRNGAVDDDIWLAADLNDDGDLTGPGEGLARWASNGTLGSEFTGLYFDPADKRRAWVNIQHPASGNDRTIQITIPADVR
jgi:secreted PhoX family phosphatase